VASAESVVSARFDRLCPVRWSRDRGPLTDSEAARGVSAGTVAGEPGARQRLTAAVRAHGRGSRGVAVRAAHRRQRRSRSTTWWLQRIRTRP